MHEVFIVFNPRTSIINFPLFVYPLTCSSTTFAISRISSFTCASVRSMSVATDSNDITAMRVGRALVHIYYKKHKETYSDLRSRCIVLFMMAYIVATLGAKCFDTINKIVSVMCRPC